MRSGVIAATVVALIVGASALLLAGGDSGSGSGGSQAKAGGGAALKSGQVDIADFKYDPPNFTVKVGTKVVFTNKDGAQHTATSETAGAFDTGDLSKGDSKTVTFKQAGDFKYLCKFHNFMAGDVKVTK